MTPSDSIGHDRAGVEILDRKACDRLLESTSVGRVAFVADGDVVILPINYRYHDGSIVFRTTSGAKLEAAARRAQMSFEIDGWDEATQTGWSVLVKGTSIDVFDEDEATSLFQLGLRPWSNAAERRRWVRIRPDDISGRKIT